MDSNHRRRKPADLQSAPVGHLGNLPAVRASGRAICGSTFPLSTNRLTPFQNRILFLGLHFLTAFLEPALAHARSKIQTCFFTAAKKADQFCADRPSSLLTSQL